MSLNPYIAGNPLRDPTAFFGRDDIVREVMQMLNHPDEKAIVLFGQRRIGKTTILLQIDQKLKDGAQFTPIYFDLQDRASSALPEVLYKLAQTIAHKLSTTIPAKEMFDEDGVYFKKKFLPDVIKIAASNGIVILFDEFDVMDNAQNNQAGRVFFPYLRTFISELEKVKFIFVIGRRPEELSTESLSTFKGIRASRVSLLNKSSIDSVIRQSEKKGDLFWDNEAVEQVWKYTQGHTFFTQLLCSIIWEKVQETSKSNHPTVLLKDVDESVQEVFKQGANAFFWIWEGLPPAERVVIAAMAEVGADVISQDQIEDVLNQSGVRLIARELKIAPMTLVEWDLLRPFDKNFQFTVPLFQQWVRSNRPLTRVKEELDKLDPLAENLYKSGQSFYGLGKTDEASQQLRQALIANPNHLKSRLLLSRILFEQGKPDNIKEAVQILEEGYKYDPIATGADLVKSLLAVADFQPGENEKINIYNRIIIIEPNQPIAQERLRNIWTARGDAFLIDKKFADALEAYKNAGDIKKIEIVQQNEQENWKNQAELSLQQNNLTKALELYILLGDESKIGYINEIIEKKWRDEQLYKAATLEQQESWGLAIQIYDLILEKQPDNNVLSAKKKAKEQNHLAILYQQAIERFDTKNIKSAQSLFAQIVSIQPKYKDAARYLYQTVEEEQFPQKETSTITKTAQEFGKSSLLVIMGFLMLSVCSFITFGFSMLFFNQFPSSSSSSLPYTFIFFILGIILSVFVSLGMVIYITKRMSNQSSKWNGRK